MASNRDLLNLIDLSLGVEPHGVVNFNYLHGLMHGIVKRLVDLESYPAHLQQDKSLDSKLEREGDEQDGVAQIPATDGDGAQIPRDGSGAESGATSASPKQGSRTSVRQYSSLSRSRPSLVSAANDLGALERKLQELEGRMSTMETLPEMLERVSADAGATPVSDMWNFTLLNKRLTATEEGLGKTSKLVDEVLGELNDLKSRIRDSDVMGKRLSEQVSGEIDTIQDKLKNLEMLKLAASNDNLGDAAVALMGDLDAKIQKMQAELNSIKDQVADSDFSGTEAVSAVLKEQNELVVKNESLIAAQSKNLSEVEKSMSDSADALGKLTIRVDSLEQEVSKTVAMTGDMQNSLRNKVNASDIASLMPSGDSGESASLMPKVLELQTKINALEAKVGVVPQDVQDQMTALRTTVDKQFEDLSSLSNLVHALEGKQPSESSGKFEDFGSQLAQLRERLNELDRAVTALSDHLMNLSHQDTETVTEPDGSKYVDLNSFNVVQGLLGQLQQEHERLMGTAAHLSHELDVNKEHVKSLYESVDDVKENKADRTQVEVEVREKADRKALDDKASRDWVDSTFEKLDKEIREARSKILDQEEAMKLAVNQLSEDVEGKLDRMELEPLKDYFEKKFDSAKVLPKVQSAQEASADDAAGIKKPLRFACLSCDKPVMMKQLGIVPTLPSITTLPGTRTFRPYTTYELEMIRRHQKLLYPLPPITELHRAARSAGGLHTLTRPRQRFRLTPYGGPTTVLPSPEPDVSNMTSRSSPLVYEETDIVGHDGHIYKGRVTRKNKPPAGVRRKGRPLTSPQKPTSYY